MNDAGFEYVAKPYFDGFVTQESFLFLVQGEYLGYQGTLQALVNGLDPSALGEFAPPILDPSSAGPYEEALYGADYVQLARAGFDDEIAVEEPAGCISEGQEPWNTYQASLLANTDEFQRRLRPTAEYQKYTTTWLKCANQTRVPLRDDDPMDHTAASTDYYRDVASSALAQSPHIQELSSVEFVGDVQLWLDELGAVDPAIGTLIDEERYQAEHDQLCRTVVRHWVQATFAALQEEIFD